MLTEERRRRIARLFLEENFGKRKTIPKKVWEECRNTMDLETFQKLADVLSHDFELWRNWDSMKPGQHVARAFDVFYPPYISGSKKPIIAVGETYEEVKEIAKMVVPEERMKYGLPEFEEYKGYYIMYD